MQKSALTLILAAVSFPVAAAGEDPMSQYEEVRPAAFENAPEPAPGTGADPARIAHGRYLVELMGCATCHTDGALLGAPNPDKRLAGSSVGIAYSNPLRTEHPGVVYPKNLTPDEETGLGRWSDEEVEHMIRTGVDKAGRQHFAIMPWPAYAKLSEQDVHAIVSYLRSLPPIENAVPENVPRGTPASTPYIHFGVYRKVPEQETAP